MVKQVRVPQPNKLALVLKTVNFSVFFFENFRQDLLENFTVSMQSSCKFEIKNYHEKNLLNYD